MHLIALDIDGTQYYMDDPRQDAASHRLKSSLENLVQKGEAIIVHNTGRPYPWRCDGEPHQRYINPIIAEPHAIIHSAGTGIVFFPDKGMSEDWERMISSVAPPEVMSALKAFLVEEKGLDLHPETFGNRHKVSCLVRGGQNLEALRETIQEAVDLKFGKIFEVFYWHGSAMDITPRGANKNDALLFLAKHFGISSEQVIVAGDALNDWPVLGNPDYKRIVVGNAVPYLKERVCGKNTVIAPADSIGAEGVLYGLRQFQVLGPSLTPPGFTFPSPSP